MNPPAPWLDHRVPPVLNCGHGDYQHMVDGYRLVCAKCGRGTVPVGPPIVDRRKST